MGKRIRTAVIGVGHLGQHHARILSGLENSELVAVVDTDAERAGMLAQKFGCEALTDFKQLAGRIDAASVVVPTKYHFGVASWLFEQGIHALVEKPLCFTVDEARRLTDLANAKGLTLQVGHIERFNPALATIRDQIDGVAFIEAHRLSPYPFRSTDIGVIMDVMIHDLDIILTLVNSEVEEIRATATPVLSRVHEDIASARIQFRNGAVASVTASRISDKVSRKMRMFCRSKYVHIDFAAKQASIYSKTPKLDDPNFSIENLDVSAVPNLLEFLFNDLISVENVTINREGEPLKAELRAFLASVESGERSSVPGEDGVRAIALAHDILRACDMHSSRYKSQFAPT